MSTRHLPATATAVTAAAVLGGLGTTVDSQWYQQLSKPPWQPPGWVFGPVWTALYAATAIGTARALDRAQPARREEIARALGVNLVLNTAWSWLFFRGRRPAWALVELPVLLGSTVDLARRTGREDPTAGRLLTPYAAWVAFAGVLNASIVARNRNRGRR